MHDGAAVIGVLANAVWTAIGVCLECLDFHNTIVMVTFSRQIRLDFGVTIHQEMELL